MPRQIILGSVILFPDQNEGRGPEYYVSSFTNGEVHLISSSANNDLFHTFVLKELSDFVVVHSPKKYQSITF